MQKNNKLHFILNIIIWCLICYLLGIETGLLINDKPKEQININTDVNKKQDSIKQVLDSIEYNIIYKDSIIYRLKEQMYEEIKQADNDNDTIVINKFFELVSED